MKKVRLFFPVLICLLNIVSAATTSAQPKASVPTEPQSVTPELRKQASDFYQRNDWTNAAEAYGLITRIEPSNAGAWSRRGVALHSLGKYKEAIAAYERSLEINNQQPVALFNLARSLARLNDRSKAKLKF